MKRIIIPASIVLSTVAPHAFSEPLTPVTLRASQSDFGGVGLMQMPSGRMAEDGEFNLGVNYNEDYTHYTASMQLFPWMEATIRYTRVPDVKYNSDPSFSGDNIYTDKGIDFKIRLLEESTWLPETSIGVRDFGGTGLFDGEYIAGTKRFGNLDVTLGVAWGYMGQSGNITNPFCKASDKYCDRDSGFKENGGSIDFERWFKGNAAIYGGLEYQTPYQPLRLKLEYDANDYTSDFPYTRGNKAMPQHTPWNVGVLYQLGDWGDAKVSYQRGDTLTLGFNFYTNFNEMRAIWRDEPKVKPVTTSQPSAKQNQWQEASTELQHNAGYAKNTIAVSGRTLTVTGEQTKYRDREEAIDRAAAVLTQYHDSYIQTYKIVETKNGLPLTQTDIDVNTYKQVQDNAYLNSKLSDATVEHEPENEDKESDLANSKPRWNAGLSPVLQQSIGGAEAFYLFNVGVNANGNVWLTDNIEASGSIYFNIADNYDKFNYEDNTQVGNSSVPRVRTLVRSYLNDPIRLNQLQMTWFGHPSQQIYTQAYGGYLESMFAGVGGEALYRPLHKNWALGIDINQITQRDPDSWFGTMHNTPYYSPSSCRSGTNCQAKVLESGTTGFATAYYMPQWHWLDDSLFKVSVGQFLAGDKGARIDFSRQFKSGVTVGAYASFTDMSAEDFGEGSYNKGFYISLPLDIMTIKPSTSRAQISWQPITRDGGQMLNRKYHLFDVTDARSPWYQRKNTSN